tara:strand:+ start:143 stop:316 length:174 start_codon:yes stop_codon:yes gene_type:complete
VNVNTLRKKILEKEKEKMRNGPKKQHRRSARKDLLSFMVVTLDTTQLLISALNLAAL